MVCRKSRSTEPSSAFARRDAITLPKMATISRRAASRSRCAAVGAVDHSTERGCSGGGGGGEQSREKRREEEKRGEERREERRGDAMVGRLQPVVERLVDARHVLEEALAHLVPHEGGGGGEDDELGERLARTKEV